MIPSNFFATLQSFLDSCGCGSDTPVLIRSATSAGVDLGSFTSTPGNLLIFTATGGLGSPSISTSTGWQLLAHNNTVVVYAKTATGSDSLIGYTQSSPPSHIYLAEFSNVKPLSCGLSSQDDDSSAVRITLTAPTDCEKSIAIASFQSSDSITSPSGWTPIYYINNRSGLFYRTDYSLSSQNVIFTGGSVDYVSGFLGVFYVTGVPAINATPTLSSQLTEMQQGFATTPKIQLSNNKTITAGQSGTLVGYSNGSFGSISPDDSLFATQYPSAGLSLVDTFWDSSNNTISISLNSSSSPKGPDFIQSDLVQFKINGIIDVAGASAIFYDSGFWVFNLVTPLVDTVVYTVTVQMLI